MFRRPSGKHTKNYGTSPFSMGKSTINHHFQWLCLFTRGYPPAIKHGALKKKSKHIPRLWRISHWTNSKNITLTQQTQDFNVNPGLVNTDHDLAGFPPKQFSKWLWNWYLPYQFFYWWFFRKSRADIAILPINMAGKSHNVPMNFMVNLGEPPSVASPN